MTTISLTELGAELTQQAEASAHGFATKPVKREGTVRQVLVGFRAGGVLPEHNNPGEAMALLLEGAVRFTVDGSEVATLQPGDLYTVPLERHTVEASDASIMLLTFAHA